MPRFVLGWALRPVDRGEELGDLRAGAADRVALPDERAGADRTAGAALREDPEERGWADLPVLPPLPPLPLALVYPLPLTTRPSVGPESAPLPRRATTMIGAP